MNTVGFCIGLVWAVMGLFGDPARMTDGFGQVVRTVWWMGLVVSGLCILEIVQLERHRHDKKE